MTRTRIHRIGDLEIRNVGLSHTANIYRGGREVDMFSFGDFSKNKTSSREFKRAIRLRQKEGFF